MRAAPQAAPLPFAGQPGHSALDVRGIFMTRVAHALFLALCLTIPSTFDAAARVPLDTFAANPAMGVPRMSPNGKHVAVPTRKGKVEKVLVYDIDTPGTHLPIDVPSDVEFNWVGWANNDRILIGLSKPSSERWFGTTYDTSPSRVIAVNRVGSNAKGLLTSARRVRDSILNLSGI